jgi:hypothetical protein
MKHNYVNKLIERKECVDHTNMNYQANVSEISGTHHDLKIYYYHY